MNHTEQMLQKMSFVKDGGDRTDIPAGDIGVGGKELGFIMEN